jgi:L-lysine 6-transaminase
MSSPSISPKDVHGTLAKSILVDGYPFVFDDQKSHEAYIVDRITGRSFLDFFTFYASLPLGFNHPKMKNDTSFLKTLTHSALHKVSNPDVYTEEYAVFVNAFAKSAIKAPMKHAFFVDGGALAVENAMKIAFDWKVRKNLAKGLGERGHEIIHFRHAFHGRSGYTMSVTNTDPNKVMYFPKFDWPRFDAPSANELFFASTTQDFSKPNHAEDAKNYETASQSLLELEKQCIAQLRVYLEGNHVNVAALLLEPIQSEGGDRHFRPSFLNSLKDLSLEFEFLMIFDEVQTGVGLTGEFWAYEKLGVVPDIVAFGKKMAICGCIATDRIDEVSNNVFQVSSRINSTFGGNLTDMVRTTRVLEIMEEDKILTHVKQMGLQLRNMLFTLKDDFAGHISTVRGQGLLCAFDLPTTESRNEFLDLCYDEDLMILSSGHRTIRMRPPLITTAEHIAECKTKLTAAMKKLVVKHEKHKPAHVVKTE